MSIIIDFKYLKKQGESAMENNEKEFGVMGDVVTTGRKVGFKVADWKKFAQSEYIAKRIFKFISEFERPHFSVEEGAEDTAVKIVNFTEVINNYFNKESFCICCGLNQGEGKFNGKFFLRTCEEFGIWLSSNRKMCVRGGGCFMPIENVLYYIIKDFLGVEEFKNDKEESMRLISMEKQWPRLLVVTAVRTPMTSDENIALLVKAFEEKGCKLKINLKV